MSVHNINLIKHGRTTESQPSSLKYRGGPEYTWSRQAAPVQCHEGRTRRKEDAVVEINH